MEVLIRPFRPDDWDGIFLLDQACFVPPYRLEYPRLRALVEDPTVAVLVIEAREEPQPGGSGIEAKRVEEPAAAEPEAKDEHAVVGGLLLKHDREAERLVVISVMVDPGFRRVGLGRRLMGWAEKIARSRQLPRLLAPLETENAEGAAFLASLGFTCEPGAPPFFADPAGGHLWSRPVADPQAEAAPAPGLAPAVAAPAAAAQPSPEAPPAPVPNAPASEPADAPETGPAPEEAH
jgi:ribosomal protein S18 acetylase RimI-like enzyme